MNLSDLAPLPALTLDHLHAFAAWLVHGPGTMRQVAGKADVPLTLLHPRTAELLAINAVQITGQSGSEGPIYSAITSGVHLPSATDTAERQLNTLPIQDQVSIAAGIMAKHGKRQKHRGASRDQSEIELKSE